MGGRDDFATALEATMARRREELGEPPTPDELLAYRNGRLDPAERELLEARIAVHPDAARALADLAAFPDVEPGPGTPDLSEEEIGARWQAFRTRLAGLPRPEPVHRPVLWRLPAAAVLTIGLLTGYLAGRSSAPEPPARPALNVTIAEVAPVEDQGETVRAPAAPVELPPDSGELVLILGLPDTRKYSGYAAEIRDREGAPLWSGSGLRPTPLGTFQLSFPSGTFAPGTYRIDLFGVDGAGRKRLAHYELRVL